VRILLTLSGTVEQVEDEFGIASIQTVPTMDN